MFSKNLAGAILIHGLLASVSQAQVVLDGTLGGSPGQTVGPGTLPNGQQLSNGVTTSDHLITHDLGTRVGNNLFHSFSQFSIEAGKSATFTGPDSIANVLSRVTGSNVSNIDGTLASTIDNANLFLLNPAGVMFGPNATLDVKGAFYSSTADFIKLGENGIFHDNLAEESVLTTAQPEAFGFLGEGTPQGVSIAQSSLEVPEGKTLSFVAGDIEISGGNLKAPDGKIILVSLASSGTATLTDTTEIQVSATSFGQIELSDSASVNVDGEISGRVIIRSGLLTVDRARISANTTGSSEGSLVSSLEAGIDIEVAENVKLINSTLLEANVTGPRDGGHINVNAGESLEVRDSIVRTFAPLPMTGGDLGDIEIHADTVLLSTDTPPTADFGPIVGLSSLTSGPGNPGDIRVTANALQMQGGFVASVTGGEGRAGTIELMVNGDISVIGNDFGGNIVANTFGTGDAGDVIISANNLRLTNDSQIQSATAGSGNASRVDIVLGESLIVENAASIDSITASSGAAGALTISARDILIQGLADSPDPTAREFRTGFSVASNPGTGPGGSLTVMADNLRITDQGSIRSVTMGPGASGNINVMVGELSLTTGSSISAESISTEDGAANAGNINLNVTDTILVDNSIVTTQADNAVGGNIKLTADNLIQIVNSDITSRVQEGSANAGSINIDPDFIIVQNSLIDSSADFGDGGDVTFIADSAILIDPFSTIDTSSRFGGNGIVDIRAPIQNLGETIAPLPEEILKVSGLFAARCAAQKDGKFSSFIPGGREGAHPGFTGFLPSPLSFSTSGFENVKTTASRLGLESIPQKLGWKIFNSTENADFVESCSSTPLSRS